MTDAAANTKDDAEKSITAASIGNVGDDASRKEKNVTFAPETKMSATEMEKKITPLEMEKCKR